MVVAATSVEQNVRVFLADYFDEQARWRAKVAKRHGGMNRLVSQALEHAARRVRKLPDDNRSLRRLVRLVKAADGDVEAAISFYDASWKEITANLPFWNRPDALSPSAFDDLLETIASVSEAAAERRKAS